MARRFRTSSVVRSWVLAVVLAAWAVGCGSDREPNNIDPTDVNGNVNKAPVAGATVTIHSFQGTGVAGAELAGPYVTDASGNWTGEIPVGRSTPVLLRSTGGTYVDESSAASVTLLSRQIMYGLMTGTSAQVTPLTHVTYLGMVARVAEGATLTDAIDEAIASGQDAFGFNFATTVPSTAAAATTGQKQYAALLGGISVLLDGNPALTAFVNTLPGDLVLGLARDMPDGRLDGLDANGDPIPVRTSTGTATAPWPALSAGGLSAWLTAANAYASATPELNGIAFDIGTLWQAAPPSSAPCQITFSGNGVAQLVDNCFIPTQGIVVNVDQLRWTDATDDVQILVVPETGSLTEFQSISITRPSAGNVAWSSNNPTGIPGITRSGGFVTFTNVTVPELTAGGTLLVLNGQLVEPLPPTRPMRRASR